MPTADQADDPCRRRRGPGRPRGPRAEGAGVRLGERLARAARGPCAEERLADPVRVGVGVADPVGCHDHDEVDAGVAPDLLRVRLQRGRSGRRRGAPPVRAGSRRRPGHGERPGRGAASLASRRRVDVRRSGAPRRPRPATSTSTCRAKSWPARLRGRRARRMRPVCRAGSLRERNERKGDRGHRRGA